LKSINLKKKNVMKNLFMLFAIFAMASCGTSKKECDNHETTVETEVVTEETVEESPLDVSEIETVGELLDTLETLPSEPTAE
jgi:uncharacterized lipoprotein YajG